jgi:glycosyltransferase involved in cell wall biosynthesis
MGNLNAGYDHDLIFRAAVTLQARGLHPRIEFLGKGLELDRWRQFVRDHKLTNVNVAGFVTGDDLWARLRHAHVLLFPIRPTIPNLSRCPSKTYAYAQARRPVITCRVGEVPTVLEEKAMYVDTTADAFADALAEVMSAPPLPDVDYHLEQHNWGVRAQTLLNALGAPSCSPGDSASSASPGERPLPPCSVPSGDTPC